MNRFLPRVTCGFVVMRLSSHLVRKIVGLRGLPTPRRHLLVPATDQVLASSDTIYLPPHRNTTHLPATTGMDHLPVANTTAVSFFVSLQVASVCALGRCDQGGGKRRSGILVFRRQAGYC